MDLGSVFDAFVEALRQRKAYAIVASAMFAANVLVDTKLWPDQIRFYHEGWIDEHKAWTISLFIGAVGSLYFSMDRRGFVVIVILAAAMAVFFGVTYERFQGGALPLLTWLAYRMALALSIGLVAAWVDRLAS